MRSTKALFAKVAVLTIAAVASVSSFAAVDVETIVDEIDGSHRPIAVVAAASLGAYVSIRVWKLVRRAI